ncbi:hypothetical protein ACFGVS_01085 [Mucilaginibacter sp. AW1-7]
MTRSLSSQLVLVWSMNVLLKVDVPGPSTIRFRKYSVNNSVTL